MVTPMGGGPDRTVERVAYFVIRIRRNNNDPAATLAGTLERLGSGRTHQFSGATELLQLLAAGASDAPRP